MDIPSLPSDNLYKFVAFAGLLITLVSLTYPLNKAEEFKLAVIDAQAEKAKIEIELAAIEQLVGELEKAKQPTPQEVSGLRERILQSQTKKIELDRLVKITQTKLDLSSKYFTAAIIGFIAGPWISFWGFRRWYVRVQKPLDEQVAKHSKRRAQ